MGRTTTASQAEVRPAAAAIALFRSPLTLGQRAVLGVLIERLEDDTRSVVATHAELAEQAGMSVRTWRTRAAELDRAGLLTVETITDERGRLTRWHVCLGCLARLPRYDDTRATRWLGGRGLGGGPAAVATPPLTQHGGSGNSCQTPRQQLPDPPATVARPHPPITRGRSGPFPGPFPDRASSSSPACGREGQVFQLWATLGERLTEGELGHLGHLVDELGEGTLLEAMARLREQYPTSRLRLAWVRDRAQQIAADRKLGTLRVRHRQKPGGDDGRDPVAEVSSVLARIAPKVPEAPEWLQGPLGAALTEYHDALEAARVQPETLGPRVAEAARAWSQRFATAAERHAADELAELLAQARLGLEGDERAARLTALAALARRYDVPADGWRLHHGGWS